MIRTLSIFLLPAVVLALLTGCTHAPDLGSNLSQTLTPFTRARDSAVQTVAVGKHSLDPLTMNQLNLSYADVESKANAYAGFLVEATTTASFDEPKNSKYASDLSTAIDNFNKSLSAIQPKGAGKPLPQSPTLAPLSKAWVPTFQASVQDAWTRYHGDIAGLGAANKTRLLQRIKAQTIWPNFENI